MVGRTAGRARRLPPRRAPSRSRLHGHTTYTHIEERSINNTPKYVASTTLDQVEWRNATLIKGSVAAEIARLKQEPGKNIGVAGSPTLVRSLLDEDLLDELKLMIHPVVAGSGKRLFKDGGEPKRLQLLDAQRTSSGVMILTYQRYTT